MGKREDAKRKQEEQEEIILTEENLDMDFEDALKDLNDRYLRVCADYDNFRRRSRLDRQQGYEEGVIDTVRQLIPVFESVDSAVKAASGYEGEESQEFSKGLKLIAGQINEALERLGVTEIPGEGALFDPQFHQVVIHEEDDSLPENTVTEVFQKGYTKGDRVIRHSMVKVVN